MEKKGLFKKITEYKNLKEAHRKIMNGEKTLT